MTKLKRGRPFGARVDKTELLEMLKDKTAIRKAAKHFDVSNQAIQQHILRFKKAGLLPKDWQVGQVITEAAKPVNGNGINLDQVEELVIARFAEAREVKKLRNQLAATQNELDIKTDEVNKLTKYYQSKEEKEKQFKLAQQQKAGD